MAKAKQSKSREAVRTVRPVLMASRRSVAQYVTVWKRLLVGLADESIPTTLICPPGCENDCDIPTPVEVLTYPLIDLPGAEHVGNEQVAGQLEKFKPTVLHCLCETKAALCRRLARRLHVPYVLAINTLLPKLSSLSISFQRCMAVIVPAETIGTHARQAHFRFADRLRTIPMGAFVEADACCFSDPNRLPCLVVAHPLQRVMDFDCLLKAAKALTADGREFMIVLMGEGRAEHRLRKVLAEYGLSEWVTIVPPLNPWRSVLAAGDIFIQPQPTGAFNALTLEAMGLGRAVVACKGGVDDLIVHNETALVFESGDVVGARRALAQLLDDHGYAQRLGKAAQAHIRSHCSVSKMVTAIIDTYVDAQQRYGSPMAAGASA
jgi:glycosyltransferase involved in cell wall biosynthesis